MMKHRYYWGFIVRDRIMKVISVNRLLRIIIFILCVLFFLFCLNSCKKNVDTETTLSDEEYFNLYQKVDNANIVVPQIAKDDSDIDRYLENELVDERSKEQLLLAKYVYNNLNRILVINILVRSNSYESPTIVVTTKYLYGDAFIEMYYHDTNQYEGAYSCDNRRDILYKTLYLWLNDKIPNYYDSWDLGEIVDPLLVFLNTYPSIEEFEQYLDDNDCQWLKTLNDFLVSEDSISDSRSKDNLYIYLVLVDNYMKYNPKIESVFTNTHVFYDDVFIRDLFVIYKEYGDAIWGQEINGEYVIEDYDKMFGALDQKIMDEFDLAPEDFR